MPASEQRIGETMHLSTLVTDGATNSTKSITSQQRSAVLDDVPQKWRQEASTVRLGHERGKKDGSLSFLSPVYTYKRGIRRGALGAVAASAVAGEELRQAASPEVASLKIKNAHLKKSIRLQ